MSHVLGHWTAVWVDIRYKSIEAPVMGSPEVGSMEEGQSWSIVLPGSEVGHSYTV